MRRRWRLLVDGSADGPWNMGVDEALLASAARTGVPTLRFYAWRGAWLSLGFAQPADPAPPRGRSDRPVGVVRRATGGRAVLHGCDLTYAVAAPTALLPEGLRASYGLIAEALLAALRALGAAAERSPEPRAAGGGSGFDCFAVAGANELCAGGRKLCGSAQRRTARAVLQHGSIRLRPDPPAVRSALGLGAGSTSLAELGCPHAPALVRSACAAAFARTLGARLDPGVLSPDEALAAAARGVAPTPGPGPREGFGFSRVPPAGR